MSAIDIAKIAISAVVAVLTAWFQGRGKATKAELDRLQRRVTKLITLFEDYHTSIRSLIEHLEELVAGLPESLRPPFKSALNEFRTASRAHRKRLDAIDDEEAA